MFHFNIIIFISTLHIFLFCFALQNMHLLRSFFCYPSEPSVLMNTSFHEELHQPVLFQRLIHYQHTFSLTSLPMAFCQPHKCNPLLGHDGEMVVLNLSCPSPISPLLWPPTPNISPHADIPLVTVVCWCLPSNQEAFFLSYTGYGMGVCRVGCTKIDCRQRSSWLSCSIDVGAKV